MNKFDGSETLHFEGQLIAKKLERLAESIRDSREDAITAQEVADIELIFKRISQELEQWKKYVTDHCQRQVPK